MDKNVCYKIVRETFQNPFDKERFLYFIKNLLNKIDESKAFHARGYVYDNYRNYVKTYERLGTYTDPDGKTIDILVVYLQKETSLERARTAQRNFIARYLKDRDQKDAGLIAFVSPNSDDWRFSLVKMDYKFEEGKSGRIKIKEEFTPARRWSFLVGKNEDSHTAKSRLVPIVENDNLDPTLKDLEEAFNIEKVTKEFFEKYRDLFLWTKETLEETIKKDPKIQLDFENKGVETVDFTKKLLGQIVFLYFLQKKGWFGVNRDADWGTGPRNFLRQLFKERHGKYDNFFNNVLEPLFYEALAREREDDFFSRFDCKIPFLNGGLFDPINNYDWIHTDILLPNDLFSNSHMTKEGDVGNGILDIFDRYNFTVKEDEPLEKEVAVDPEMLGKVFENLLEVKDRKSKGSFYSPREIVHYMCQQSLISYLEIELGDKVPRSDIENLIKYGEMVGENEAHVEKKGSETNTYYYKLPESIRNNAKLIDEKLSTIKICDPAIGSGAFPVGMMSEIVRARNTLSIYIKSSHRTVYDFKRDCIQNSLYGVDIDPGAVEIAKLRLWLSLVVDEDDIKQIKPLPNLDYKIMQGNSLLEEFEGIKLFDDKLITPIQFDNEEQISSLKQRQTELQKEYFKLHSTNRLTPQMQLVLKEELDRISLSLKNISTENNGRNEYLGLFDKINEAKKKGKQLKRYQQEFFETTQKKRKDEIKQQIAKLEWELIELTLKEEGKLSELRKLEEFKKSNTKPFFLWKLNFAEVFQEKNGFDVVIANPPYITIGLGKKQKFFSEKEISTLKRVFHNLFEYKGNTYALFLASGIHLANKNGIITYIIPNTLLLNSTFEKIRQFLVDNCDIKYLLNMRTKVFENAEIGGNLIIILSKQKQQQNIVRMKDIDQIEFFNEKVVDLDATNQDNFSQNTGCKFYIDMGLKDIISKMSLDSISLGEIVKFYQGIITGNNNKFLSNERLNNNYFPILRGRDINRYLYTFNNTYILFDKKVLWSNTNEELFHVKEKLINRQTGDSLVAAYDNKGYFTLDSTHIQILKNHNFQLKFILALFNSKALNFCYNCLVMESGRVFAQLKTINLKTLPIKNLPIKDQNPFVDIVDQIVAITNSGDYLENYQKQARVKEYEHQIDEMVYKLYGLTQEEVEIISQEKTTV